jgi:predicted ATPase
LATVKSLAQLGATLGREFSDDLLQDVSTWDEATVQRGLHQLVAAEFLYQQGLPPQAMYRFKHALIQDAAYQSLLRSTRQQHHQRVAQVVEARFPEVCETQPELLAYHYTEAGVMAQVIPYWLQAGQLAVQRSANVEGVAHLAKGLDLLATLPDTPERAQQGLVMQTTLGSALMATKGYAAPEVLHAYARARALCQQVGQHDTGLPPLDEALALTNDTGERRWEAELYRLKGEVLLVRTGEYHVEAETCFRQAVDVARRQQAKSAELRAAMSLCRLWQQQGKRDEARQLLVEIYAWFTEGFDTADLQEANALIEELS